MAQKGTREKCLGHRYKQSGARKGTEGWMEGGMDGWRMPGARPTPNFRTCAESPAHCQRSALHFPETSSVFSCLLGLMKVVGFT